MASLPSSRLDACPRPLPRPVHAQFPPPATATPFVFTPSLLAFVIFCSTPPLLLQLFGYTPHYTVPRHTKETMFFSESSLMRFCSRNHSEIIYVTHRVVSLRVFCLRQHLDLFKAMTKVAHGSFSWPRDICKQRACLLMRLSVSPRKQHSCIMQTKVTQKTITKHLHHTNVSRFDVVQDQFGALQIANISAHQRPACKPDVAASVGGANEDGVV